MGIAIQISNTSQKFFKNPNQKKIFVYRQFGKNVHIEGAKLEDKGARTKSQTIWAQIPLKLKLNPRN